MPRTNHLGDDHLTNEFVGLDGVRPSVNTGNGCIEQFVDGDLLQLRRTLLQSCADTFHAGQLVMDFLRARGYGVNLMAATELAPKITRLSASALSIQRELERVAQVM